MSTQGQLDARSQARGDGEPQDALRSALGHTRAGEPLSRNRAPAPDLAPWVAQVYATKVEMPADRRISCSMLTDTPVMRVLFTPGWTAETADGHGRYGPSALLFGAQTRRMPVSVKGNFATVGVALKPGAMAALKGPDAVRALDRIIPYDHIYGNEEWGTSEQIIAWYGPDNPPERWLEIAEKLVRQLIEYCDAHEPDPLIGVFDKAVFADPNLVIGDFAQEHGVERRRLERLIKRAYGQTAKQVLRRARALDFAAHLRGVADEGEADEAMLRFFDQSHMIREFQAFFGMTPRQFAAAELPLLTLTLEARQARRLEVLGRATPGKPLPWRT